LRGGAAHGTSTGRSSSPPCRPSDSRRTGKNYNYYDDPKLFEALRPFIVKNLRVQLGFGARRDVAVVLGTGRNFEFFGRLNSEEKFFDKLLRRRTSTVHHAVQTAHVNDYLDKYEGLLRSAL